MLRARLAAGQYGAVGRRTFHEGAMYSTQKLAGNSAVPAVKAVLQTPYKYKMPAGYDAKFGDFKTFPLPMLISSDDKSVELGKEMVQAWRTDGIFEVKMTSWEEEVCEEATAASHRFFARPPDDKAKFCNDRSYGGYTAVGAEVTNGVADLSEIYTVVKNLPDTDHRVLANWPCHGPCPFPDDQTMYDWQAYLTVAGSVGQRVLQLTELGLGVPRGTLTNLTQDGWHHLRNLRFPAAGNVNPEPHGKGKHGRGIGAHTDYGLLVISSQDRVGGLFIRPPDKDAAFNNWEKGAAGLKEDGDGWVYVPPKQGVFTVFPGDIMQYLTSSYLRSTPHKVGLNTQERFSHAYFHEPNFMAFVRPLPMYMGDEDAATAQATTPKEIHYGRHLTNIFMRSYPRHPTTLKLREQGNWYVFGGVPCGEPVVDDKDAGDDGNSTCTLRESDDDDDDDDESSSPSDTPLADSDDDEISAASPLAAEPAADAADDSRYKSDADPAVDDGSDDAGYRASSPDQGSDGRCSAAPPGPD